MSRVDIVRLVSSGVTIDVKNILSINASGNKSSTLAATKWMQAVMSLMY